jgi:hypothetical protein
MTTPSALQDPAGLLDRIAELRPLCSDPGVRRAVATGNAFKVYRALAWARLTGRLGAHRRTLAQLLRNRRAFARPLKGNLFLGTFNSVGATLVGSAEAEPDGTHVATHSIVFLFRIPIFPLGAYVVRHEGKSGLRTSWRIFARVPLGGLAWLWSRAVAAAVALAVAAGAYGAFHAVRHHDLTIVNGFGRSLQVTVGRATLQVPGGQRRTVNLPVGTHPARALSEEGEVLDEGPLAVEAGSGLLVWNVAGAAPVMERQVQYYAGAVPGKAAEPDPVLHCGERRISLRGVDYPFESPPQKISMPEGMRVTVKRAVLVAQQEGADGPLLCSYVLSNKKDWAGAAAILERRARAARWEMETAARAVWAAGLVGKEEGVRVARAWRDAQTEDVNVHRGYQNVVEKAGGIAQLREEYRRRAEAAPDSVGAQYLYARILPEAERSRAAEGLLKRFPEDQEVLRLVAWSRLRAGDWAGADRAWRALLTRSAPKAGELAEVDASALAEMGRQAEGLHVLEDLLPRASAGDRPDIAVLHAQLALRAGAPSPDRLMAGMGKDAIPILRAMAGLPSMGEEEASPIAEVLRLAGSDPASALKKLADLGPAAVPALGGDAWMLLYAEALRTGEPVREVLEATQRLDEEDVPVLQRFIRGEPGATLPPLAPAQRAAAELVRSRNAGLPAAERAALRAAALKDDVLGTVVSRAVQAWPAPAR